MLRSDLVVLTPIRHFFQLYHDIVSFGGPDIDDLQIYRFAKSHFSFLPAKFLCRLSRVGNTLLQGV